MLKDLPEFVQKQVLHYLKSDNFTAAKALHDAWLRHESLSSKKTIQQVKKTETPDYVSEMFAPVRPVTKIEETVKSDE